MTSELPEKLTEAQFQPIIDEMIGSAGSVLSQHLPGLLDTYERTHSDVILDAADHETLRKLCEQHTDLELGPQELLHFLTTIPKHTSRPVSPSVDPPTPSISSTLSSPSDSRPRRRHSDRIKSPSDSSSSSSSEDDATRQRKRASKKAPNSAPAGGSTQTSRPFPADTYALPAALPSSADGPRAPAVPRRMKTVSESSVREDSPFSTRMRTAMVPPSAYGNIGFSRPPPAGHWRRSSRDFSGHSADEPMTSPEDSTAKLFSRSLSSSSISFSSPPRNRSGRDSPSSPSVDNTSYHNAKSPPTDLETDNSLTDIRTEEPEDFDLDSIGVADDSMLLVPADTERLAKLTTASSASLRSSHDKLRELQKQNTELQRKLQESRKGMDVAGAENDRMVLDLQLKLDETEQELALRKKDDHDRRSKERSQALAMAALEAEVEGLKRTLEHTRSAHANIQKMYSSQCEESQRLRDVMRNKEDEIRELEELANTHQMEEDKYAHEVRQFEAEIERLQQDLRGAQRAENILETQKQENMQLKETIDRMRFEMEEMRTLPSLSVGGTQSLTPSIPPTLTRNLGAEISRRMGPEDDHELGPDAGEAPMRERVIETVITRTTVINGGHTTTSDSSTIVNRDVEYVDASIGTDPLPEAVIEEAEAGPSNDSSRDDIPPHSPPAYTANPEPINEKEVLDRAHPREHSGPAYFDDDDSYDFLAHKLGLKCKVYEEEISMRRSERQKQVAAGLAPPPNPNQIRRKRSQTYSGVPTDEQRGTRIGGWAVWTCAAFAIGMAVGTGIMSGGPAGVNPRDAQLFTHMNTIAVAAGVGEGFFPNAVAGALDQGARLFVPT